MVKDIWNLFKYRGVILSNGYISYIAGNNLFNGIILNNIFPLQNTATLHNKYLLIQYAPVESKHFHKKGKHLSFHLL
jgi:hypothetical protein